MRKACFVVVSTTFRICFLWGFFDFLLPGRVEWLVHCFVPKAGVMGLQHRHRYQAANDMEDELLSSQFLEYPPNLRRSIQSGMLNNTSLEQDAFFRALNAVVSKPVLYLIRDSGLLRALADMAVLLGVPSVVGQYPSALGDLLRLLGNERLLLAFLTFLPRLPRSSLLVQGDVQHERLDYGNHRSQVVRIVSLNFPLPNQCPSNASASVHKNSNKVLIFVHGGAWGSGFPIMYLLAATPFVNRGYTFCAVGYRTYPDADCLEQAQDVVCAIQRIQREMEKQQCEYTLLAHSSGTHICSLAFTKGLFSSLSTNTKVDRFIGLAGVFDIAKHYKFERGRGVARFSPMAPACGTRSTCCSGTKDNRDQDPRQRGRTGGLRGGEVLHAWRHNSPIHNLRTATKISTNDSSYAFPEDCLFIHGALDTTCPPSYTEEFGRALKQSCRAGSPSRRVNVQILPSVEHAGMVLELMFGGPTLDVILEFLNAPATGITGTTSELRKAHTYGNGA